MTQFSIDNFFDDLGSKNKTSDSEDLSSKKVYIIFKTNSIGDTLAWIPYVEEFRKKHNCKVVCATYYNNWFKNEYKDIEFVEIGGDPRNPIYPVIDNVHDTYEISYLNHPIWVDNLKNPEFTGKVIPPLQQLIADILDLEYKEIKPKVSIPNKERDIKEKYVCISIQSTAQCKYWNCKGGWNEIVRYLKSLGYKVVCIDRDKQFGVSGQFNKIPKGVIDKTGNIPLTERMVTLKYADFLISISSGLSWLSWSVGTPVIMISSFTKPFFEFQSNNIRVYKEHSNSGFYNTHRIDPWNWNWNPIKECKTLDDWDEFEPIREDMVIDAIDRMMISQRKKVFMKFGSDSIGDTLAWIPYVEEFRKKHNCKVVCATYWNHLFKDEYKEIEFLEIEGGRRDRIYPIVDDADDIYEINSEYHIGSDKEMPPLQQISTDILDLEYKEIKPKVSIPNKERNIKEKYVCIAIQSTTQCKYWNWENGWQEIVDYLNEKGYKVVCIDMHKKFGGSGCYNEMPERVIDKTGDISLKERMVDLKYADFFIGLGSGLSWLAWAVDTPTILISSMSKPFTEFQSNVIRLYNDNEKSGYWNDFLYTWDCWDWNWNPIKECKTIEDWHDFETITPQQVKTAVDDMIKGFEKIDTHDTKEKALKQLAAIEISKSTDKNTIHSYIDTYEKLFSSIKDTTKNVLEIGIQAGGSLLLWHDYFENAIIYGIDNEHEKKIPNWLNNYDRIKTYNSDAYNTAFIKNEFINKNKFFDIIIDDGPHTKESMIFTAEHYSKLLTDNGILIIEDVQSMEWVDDIISSFPKKLQKNVKVVDLRYIKGRYDDILIICTITPQQVKTAVDEMIIKTDIKKVYIHFGSQSLGDSIGWIPYCLEYQKKFNVNEVVVSTYWNNLFKSVYPELTFVEPGEVVNNINKRHTIDFYGLNMFSTNTELLNNPLSLKNYKECGVQGQATNCLGLEYTEIKPRIVIPDKSRKIKGKYVCIAIQSTTQAKYWNLKGGWDAIIKYLRKKGYKVVCIDKHNQFGTEGYWNFIPKGVIDKTGDFPIEDRIVDIKHAEFFIGLSSGLAWVAHAVGTPVVMISGFTKPWNEFTTNVERVHNINVCNGCWHTHEFNPGDWTWCPEHKGTEREFECTKQITFQMVKEKINNIIKKGI